MKFLQDPPRFLFFTGKGGVGKTSLACASAISLAERGGRVLLVSTDPASNIAQVFGIPIGAQITAISTVPGLSALEIDPAAAAQVYRERIVGPVRGKLPASVIRTIEEQLSGACTTEIASFDEFTALLIDPKLVEAFDHILFDTAPTGHTIRLLQLPGAWSEFLETGTGDASCLGPLAGLEKQRTQYKEAVDALADPLRTRMILVARPQTATLREVARTHTELAAIGLTRQFLVVNGVLEAVEATSGSLASGIYRQQQTAIKQMPVSLGSLPTDTLALKPNNMVGLTALRALLSSASVPLVTATKGDTATIDTAPLAKLIDELAPAGKGLIMLMGKGGVGKTTLAAAVAVALARRGLTVHLSTSDPAAHLSETLAGSVPNLSVSSIDPAAETARYRERILSTKGKALDAAGLALLKEDLQSPCTEEIAVFQAFSSVIRKADEQFVVMDTAPTGHTLLLLDATGAYHREVVRQSKSPEGRFTTPLMRLQDPTKTKVILVTLAETTPVLEAKQLEEDLARASIKPWAWIVNNSVAAAHPEPGLFLERALNEIHEIEKVRSYTDRLAIVPLMAEEPVGETLLQKLTQPNSPS